MWLLSVPVHAKPQQITFVFATEIWNFRHFHYYDVLFCCRRCCCCCRRCFRSVFVSCASCYCHCHYHSNRLGACSGFSFDKKGKKKKDIRSLSSLASLFLNFHCAAQILWHSLPPQKKNNTFFYPGWVTGWVRKSGTAATGVPTQRLFRVYACNAQAQRRFGENFLNDGNSVCDTLCVGWATVDCCRLTLNALSQTHDDDDGGMAAAAVGKRMKCENLNDDDVLNYRQTGWS